jgi:outer membrane protein assembly factor BamB
MNVKLKTLSSLAALALITSGLSGCAAVKKDLSKGFLGIGSGDKDTKKKKGTPTVGNRIPILTSETGVEVDPALADVAVLLSPANLNDGWTQPGGNSAKSMDHVALGTSIGQVWSVNIAGSDKKKRLAASPVISNGKLYVMDTEGQVRALDTRNGGQLWSVSLDPGGKGNRPVWGGGVSIEGDVVYATTGLGDVFALNASDGKTIWKKRPSGPLRGSPSLGIGSVFVMTADNQLIALNATTGETQWTEAGATELAGVFGVAAPAVAQGTVVAGFSSGELNAYRYENGRSLWADALTRTNVSTSVSALADIDASPVVDRGRVYAVGKGGRMVSIELGTGQRLWEVNLSGISTPWISGEWLFVVTDDARLVCLSRGNGKVRWVSQLQRFEDEKDKKGQITWTGPVLAGDRLVLANSQGQLVNVAPGDGKVQSVTKADGPVFLPPVVAGNTLYILTNEGRLSAWR